MRCRRIYPVTEQDFENFENAALNLAWAWTGTGVFIMLTVTMYTLTAREPTLTELEHYAPTMMAGLGAIIFFALSVVQWRCLRRLSRNIKKDCTEIGESE